MHTRKEVVVVIGKTETDLKGDTGQYERTLFLDDHGNKVKVLTS